MRVFSWQPADRNYTEDEKTLYESAEYQRTAEGPSFQKIMKWRIA